MISNLLYGYDFTQLLVTVCLLPILLFALSIHEFMHGYVAYKLGDQTAYYQGRLTLNPIHHFDIAGLICMVLLGFGWAKPVPINPRNFKNPKVGMAITAAAGPFSNGILGVLNIIVSAFFGFLFPESDIWNFVASVFYYAGYINFLFMIFNLLPIPPCDGSRIVNLFLPSHLYFKVMRHEREIMFTTLAILLVLSRFGLSPFSFLADLVTDNLLHVFGNLFIKLFY